MPARRMRAGGLTATIAAVLACALPASRADEAPGVPQQTLLRYLANPDTLTLIDARSAEEYAAAHIDGARNLPADSDELDAAMLPAALDSPIVVYCRTGKRATQLKARLARLGYRDVRVLAPEQVFWSDGLAVFNCAAAPTRPPEPTAARAGSPQEGESE